MVCCSVISILMFVSSLLNWSYHVTSAQSVLIQLNENGSLAENSPVPACLTGSRINILSYKYYNRTCPSTCFYHASEELSPEAELQLHEACSFKEKCTNMTFPVADIKGQGFNAVDVKYRCEDLEEKFLDMCSNDQAFLKTEKHIILNELRPDIRECVCFINSGTFSITVSDLRLQSKYSQNCSSHTLTISTRQLSCNDNDRGNMFHHQDQNWISKTNAMVALTGITVTSQPQMVWLTLTPNSNERTKPTITCDAKYTTTTTTTTTPAPRHPADATTDSVKMPEHEAVQSDQESSQEPTGVIPAVVVSIVVLLFIGLLGLLVYYTRIRRRQRFDADKNGGKVPQRNLDTCSSHWLETAKDTNDDIEDRRVSNIYNCINDSFTIETDDNVENDEEEEYDTSLKQTKVCRNLDYNHLSEVGKPNISNALGNLLRSQDKTVYSLAKSNEEK